MFLSGIFYDYESIAPDLQQIFLLNPMAFLIKSYQNALLYGVWPDFEKLALFGFIGILASVLAFTIYKNVRHVIPRVIL